MSEKDQRLEHKFVFRLVKVLYILTFVLSALFVLGIGWTLIPNHYIDSDKSTLICDNGKNYSLESTHLFVISRIDPLTDLEKVDARKICAYGVVNDFSDRYFKLKTPSSTNYKLNLVESISGSWWNVLLWCGLGLLTTYAILNLLKEAVLYVFLGKKFSWEWLRGLVSFVREN